MPRCLPILLLAAPLLACGPEAPEGPAAEIQTEPELGADGQWDMPPADDPTIIVFLGDSLFAGFGLEEGQAAPDVFARQFRHPQSVAVEIVNSGRNGGTAERALQRFDERVPEGADVVLIEFGANDIYNGRSLEDLAGDLTALARRADEIGARPVVVGMAAPSRASGPPKGTWAEVAEATCADLYPFYFQALIDPAGRTLDRSYMQADGLHPNAEGAEAVGIALADWMEQALARPRPCEME